MDKDEPVAVQEYRPSGKVNWGKFLPLSMLVLVISGSLAYLLHFALIHGFYYIFIVPALAALIVAGFELLAISRGHCRSRVAAILLGVIAGLFLYLGHYYVGMIELVGPRSAFKLPLLPRYIALRMSTQS